MKRAYRFCLRLVLLSGLPGLAYAQTPLDAGALQQQIEKERKTLMPTPGTTPSPETTPELKQAPAKDKLQITVKLFRFEGNTLLTDEELSAALASYLDHPVSFQELQQAAAVVGEAYRAKGWVVRSFLPKQDIADGVVTITIIEAKFGKTHTEGDLDIRLPEGQIDAMVSAQQKTNEPLNTKALDRALLLIDDLPGISAAGRLQEGEAASETDLVIKQSKEALMSGAAIVDNEGSRATGNVRAHGFFQFSDPFGWADQFMLYALGAEGLDFARIEGSLPLGYDGWRVGANTSALRYDTVPAEFKSLDGEGNSVSVGLQLSYPLIRARQYNMFLGGNYDHRYFDNDAQGSNSSNYTIDDYTISLNGNILDKLGGGGSTNASLGFTYGTVNLQALDAGETPELSGTFSKLSYSIARQQMLTPSLSFSLMFSGQATPEKRLDSSEMFYLGGPNSVRAYPVSEGNGISGQMVNAELRWRFATNYQLSGFYDYGYIHNSGSVDSYNLDGAGIALAWQSKSGLSVNATWAHRIGDNPNPTSTGGDQDGSSLENRFWLAASKRF